jgi:putative protease
VFVHGALCIAYSGRCLLSGYFNHRDANQGTCTNSCRWDYRIAREDLDAVAEIPVDAIKRHPRADEVYYLEERERPGEFMPIFEDEHGTYIMNSRDLRAVEHVQRLTEIGVDCLKIEGRTKSHYYTARTTQVYRRAIDDAAAGRPFDPGLLAELENLSNRGYTDGFFQRHESQELQSYRQGASISTRSQFVAEVVDTDPVSGLSRLAVKNKFRVGDEMELVSPRGNRRFRLEAMADKNGKALDEAPGGGWEVMVPLPGQADAMTLLTRLLDQADTSAP